MSFKGIEKLKLNNYNNYIRCFTILMLLQFYYKNIQN